MRWRDAALSFLVAMTIVAFVSYLAKPTPPKFKAGEPVRIMVNGKRGVIRRENGSEPSVRYVDDSNRINDLYCKESELEPWSEK
jgi:hypothetical protein